MVCSCGWSVSVATSKPGKPFVQSILIQVCSDSKSANDKVEPCVGVKTFLYPSNYYSGGGNSSA